MSASAGRPRDRAPARTLALLFGLLIAGAGVAGIVTPEALVGLSQDFVTSRSLYVLAAVRVGFGLVLLRAAPASRAPRGLRVLGAVVVVLGIATALTGLAALGAARWTIAVWAEQGPLVVRATCVALLVLGAFVTYACAPGPGSRSATR